MSIDDAVDSNQESKNRISDRPMFHRLRELIRRTRIGRRTAQTLHRRIENMRVPGDPLDAMVAMASMVESDPSPRESRKGAPHLARIKRLAARTIVSTARSSSAEGHESLLDKARHLAALDVQDDRGFEIFMLSLAATNGAALDLLKQWIKPLVVLHVSCEARLERAADSTASFNLLPADKVSQLTIVGGARSGTFDFDPRLAILRLPEGDGYDQLPSKVIGAFFVLAATQRVDAVLKVDDDHRLRDPEALIRTFRKVAASNGARLYGNIQRAWSYGFHSRSWHFDKCPGLPVDRTPFTFLGPVEWIEGGSGYLINKAGLLTMLWAYIYFEQQIRHGLYEDMVAAELISKLGGRIRMCSLHGVLSTIENY